MHTRPYREKGWAAVREIYGLSKPDELRGVVETAAIPPLESDHDMLALFRDSRIVVMEDADRIIGFCGNHGTVYHLVVRTSGVSPQGSSACTGFEGCLRGSTERS